ncbi:MAG: class I SAM-dependent methyltransferase [Crocinitomicaceae bacterium]|nr:class I SAM-dependent methyltransferase [Crocinitomicaceae bacterium]
MHQLDGIKNVDIYLLDQYLKGNLNSSKRVLDAGFGKGRNLRFCFEQEMETIGIDPNEGYVQLLHNEFPKKKDEIIHSSIEDFADDKGFDFIICNAVLHFAKNHAHFDQLFEKLTSLLRKDGILFIRMTSDIGIERLLSNGIDGVYKIPDGSPRYLITRNRIATMEQESSCRLIEPIKTVNVQDVRCMTTLVLQKQ